MIKKTLLIASFVLIGLFATVNANAQPINQNAPIGLHWNPNGFSN